MHCVARRRSEGGVNEVAKDSGAIAARSDSTAYHLAARLPLKLKRETLPFSAALVASEQNRRYWPVCDDSGCVRSLSAAASSFVTSYEGEMTSDILHDLSLPADQLTAFVDYLIRHEARSRSGQVTLGVTCLHLLPSPSQLVSLDETLGALLLSTSLLQKLQSIAVEHVTLTGTPRGTRLLTTFLKRASQLRCLSLVQCGLRDASAALLRALRDNATLTELSLMGNDIGLIFDTEDSEVGTALCELLRLNKFLLRLDLSHNNCSSGAIVRLMHALADSDTQLRPADLPPEPAVNEVPIANLVSADLFITEMSGDDTPNISDEEQEEEQEEEAEDEGEATMRDDESDEEKVDDDEENTSVQDSDGVGEDDEKATTDEGKRTDANDEEDEVNEENDGDKEERRRGRWLKRVTRRHAKEQRQVMREERQTRRALLATYVQVTTEVASELNAIRSRRREEKRVATEVFCKRRSGWSHLQRLCLRGNCVRDRGAQAIAAVLRNEVPMTAADTRRVWRTTRQAVHQLVKTLLQDRLATRVEEQAVWCSLREAAAAHFAEVLRTHGTRQGRTEEDAIPAFPTVTAVSSVKGDKNNDDGHDTAEASDDGGATEEEGEEYMAPTIVMTNVEPVEEAAMDADDNAVPVVTIKQECVALGLNPDEYTTCSEDEEEAERDQEGDGKNDDDDDDNEDGGHNEDERGTVLHIPIPTVKPGMNSLTYLDIGSCQVSSRGLKSMALVLESNKTLRTLLLRNNPLGTCNQRGVLETEMDTRLTGHAEPGDEVESGFVAFAAMLHHNTTLEYLDLGFCQVTSAMLHRLAAALRENNALKTLVLDGNRFCVDESAVSRESACDVDGSALQALLKATACSALCELDLSSNDIGTMLWHGEVQALADASATLTVLHLSHAALRGEHAGQWAITLQDRVCTLTHLDLSRNAFAGEADGAGLGTLLSHCTRLTELTLDGNPRLTSRGLAVALDLVAGSMSSLHSLSCSGVATTAEVTVARPTIPTSILATLHSLCLADVDVQSEEELVQWLQYCQRHAPRLRFLTLWTRRFGMACCLPALWSIVRTMPSLLFVDFGALLHCDGMPNPDDTLHAMEQELVRRRMASIGQYSSLQPENP